MPLDADRSVLRRVLAKSGATQSQLAFGNEWHCFPDQAWFGQAVEDEQAIPRAMPHLFWLCREVLARLDPDTPCDAADPWLDALMTPVTQRPSGSCLAMFRKRLAGPLGSSELAFVRGFVREAALIEEDPETACDEGLYLVQEHPRLYRACVLPRIATHIAALVVRTGSVRAAADAILRMPEHFSFRNTRPRRPGVMPFGTHDDVEHHYRVWSVPNVLRGSLWMIAAAGDPGDLDWLMPIAERAMARRDPGRFNRLVRTIGLIGTPTAVRGLARMRRRVRHATMLGQLNAALGDAASAVGLTTAEAEEFAALDHGLDNRQSRRHVLAGGTVAILSLGGSGSPRISYEAPGGAPLGRLPASVKDDGASKSALATLRADAKALAADLAVHRLRLERSWLTGQSWGAAAFGERWLGHPVLGWLARRQIWTVTGGDKASRTCLFAEDGGVLDADGNRSSPLDAACVLNLWHPLHASGTDLVARWRQTLTRLELAQPIRQAWRETYVMTEAENESSPDSRRYAFHVLNHFQALELARQRGWRARTLVPHIPSSDGAPWMLVMPGFGVCAELRTAGVGAVDLGRDAHGFTHIVTDRVRFRVVADRGDWKRDGARKLTITEAPVRLRDVDPVVFSEVMRDIDLLVSVSATTLDVGPEDLLLVPEIGEWRRQAGLAEVPLPREPHFGGVARVRREVLEAILPELVPPGAVELQTRHAIVHGRRFDYRVHLGSGEVLVLPHHRQLVLSLRVPPEAPQPPRLTLALHDDVRLHMIVDSIAILVRDDRIRDRSVMAQLEAFAGNGA